MIFTDYSTSGLNTVHSYDSTFKEDCEKKVNKPKMLLENPKPKQSVWKLLLVNVLSCGLEMCIATVLLYTPPRLLQAGMEERYMTMVLAVGPVLALICIPMIGSASDSSHGRFGRRRPFIWMLSLGALLGLQVMPQAWSLARLISPQHSRWLEAVLLAGAVGLIDFCTNASLPLLMALLSDLFPREEENHRAFSVNSLMTSLGGCLGFLLPAVDWSRVPIAIYLGGQETFVYALITFLLLICLLTTAFIPEDKVTRGGDRKTVTPLKSSRGRYCPPCTIITLGRCASALASVIPRVHAECMRVPAVLWRLFVAELFSWMALLSVISFFADFMGEGLYYGVPNAKADSHKRKLYDEGVRVASLGLLLQCVVSGLCSILMKFWVALLGARVVYMSGVVLLVIATAFMSISNSVVIVTLMVAATGYSLTTLHVVPYTLLCLYHSDSQAFFAPSMPKPGHTGGLTLVLGAGGAKVDNECRQVSQRGICFDMALLDCAYLLSQVLTAMCLGSVVQLVSSVRAYMASACCFSLLAFFCSTSVVYSRAELQR